MNLDTKNKNIHMPKSETIWKYASTSIISIILERTLINEFFSFSLLWLLENIFILLSNMWLHAKNAKKKKLVLRGQNFSPTDVHLENQAWSAGHTLVIIIMSYLKERFSSLGLLFLPWGSFTQLNGIWVSELPNITLKNVWFGHRLT